MKKTNIALAILMALSVQYANAQTAPTSLSSAAKSAAAYQPAAWDSNQTYASAGILVSWKGKIYQSAHWTSGDEPDPIKTYGPWRLHVGAVVAPEEVPFTDPEDFELEEYDEPGSVIKPSVVVTPEEVPLTNPEDFELEEYDEPGSVIRPTVEEPTVVVPVIEKPTVVVPVIEKPVVVVPVVEKPVVEVPVIEKPVVVVPVIEKPVVVVPVIEKPVVVVP
ncbi:carbohydrate-binding protein, partial [Glaciimonas sp. GG7]